MQRTCCKTYTLSKGLTLLSPSEKLSPAYYRHFIRNDYSIFGATINPKYSIPNVPSQRFGSSHSGSGKGGGGKAALLGGVTIVSLIGGTVGYASIDSDFRNYIEENIPGAKEGFEVILGNTVSSEG